MRALTRRELNRALLARQQLLERAPLGLPEALEDRSGVQGTLMSVTIHRVSPRDYWPFALAMREARRALWLRAWKEPDADAMAAAARTLAARLDGGALSRKRVEALIGKPATRGIHLWLDRVRVPPSTARSPAPGGWTATASRPSRSRHAPGGRAARAARRGRGLAAAFR